MAKSDRAGLYNKEMLKAFNERVLNAWLLDASGLTAPEAQLLFARPKKTRALTFNKPLFLPSVSLLPILDRETEFVKTRVCFSKDHGVDFVQREELLQGRPYCFTWHTSAEKLKQGVRWGIIPVESLTGKVISALGHYRVIAHERVIKGVISANYRAVLKLLDEYQDGFEKLQKYESLVIDTDKKYLELKRTLILDLREMRRSNRRDHHDSDLEDCIDEALRIVADYEPDKNNLILPQHHGHFGEPNTPVMYNFKKSHLTPNRERKVLGAISFIEGCDKVVYNKNDEPELHVRDKDFRPLAVTAFPNLRRSKNVTTFLKKVGMELWNLVQGILVRTQTWDENPWPEKDKNKKYLFRPFAAQLRKSSYIKTYAERDAWYIRVKKVLLGKGDSYKGARPNEPLWYKLLLFFKSLSGVGVNMSRALWGFVKSLIQLPFDIYSDYRAAKPLVPEQSAEELVEIGIEDTLKEAEEEIKAIKHDFKSYLEKVSQSIRARIYTSDMASKYQPSATLAEMPYHLTSNDPGGILTQKNPGRPAKSDNDGSELDLSTVSLTDEQRAQHKTSRWLAANQEFLFMLSDEVKSRIAQHLLAQHLPAALKKLLYPEQSFPISYRIIATPLSFIPALIRALVSCVTSIITGSIKPMAIAWLALIGTETIAPEHHRSALERHSSTLKMHKKLKVEAQSTEEADVTIMDASPNSQNGVVPPRASSATSFSPAPSFSQAYQRLSQTSPDGSVSFCFDRK